MLLLRRGDQLPTVAVLQSYLVRKGHTHLVVDGIFGRQTERAVRSASNQMGLGQSGRVNYMLWQQLIGRDQQIIDSVDLTDTQIQDDVDLAPYGQTIVRQYGMSLGVINVVASIKRNARTGKVVLLRFHGHGSPGSMIVSSGGIDRGSSFDYRYTSAGFNRLLREFRPIFSSYGSIELHGCRIGLGRRGTSLLKRIANNAGVPVTGGISWQYGGGSTTFRFEGPTKTVCPNGQSLKSWSKEKLHLSHAF